MLSALAVCQQIQETLNIQPEQLLSLLDIYQSGIEDQQEDCRSIPQNSGCKNRGVSRPCSN